VPSLEDFLARPMTPPDPSVVDAVERGPIDARQALSADRLELLLDPLELPGECGWCALADGCGYVAMRTEMPGSTGEMIDWWFDWHPHDSVRYRVWHPLAHQRNSVDPATDPGEKPYWGTVHHPVEDVGLGTVHARIAFHPPEAIGFPAGALDRPDVAAIVGGYAGDDRRRMQHTKMVHVFLRSADGLVLRSRVWLGSSLRPYIPEPFAGLAARILNRPSVRRRLVPARAARALACHCAEEYANLAALLPELYEHYGPADRRTNIV
jgi:hypothetical protein